MTIKSSQLHPDTAALLTLLHPRGQERLFAAASLAGLLLAWLSVTRLSIPLWGGIVLVLGLLFVPLFRKWQADRMLHGTPVMVLSVLLVTQSLHTVEHIAQWVQYHLLGWELKVSSGLISPLNAEIVHFTWNVGVLLAVSYLFISGMRTPRMALLLLWAGAHTAEHTYLFINYLWEVERLAEAGLPLSMAQGLPGFFGRSGWLANNTPTSGPVAFLCTFAPGLTSAPRLDVHFWWNVGESSLLLLAAYTHRQGKR